MIYIYFSTNIRYFFIFQCSVLEFFFVCKSLIKWSEDVQLITKQLDGTLSSEILTDILNDIPQLLEDVKSLLNALHENNVRFVWFFVLWYIMKEIMVFIKTIYYCELILFYPWFGLKSNIIKHLINWNSFKFVKQLFMTLL